MHVMYIFGFNSFSDCLILLHTPVDFQESKRYSFPVTLNMKEFCESSDETDQEYELFSVVIHGYVPAKVLLGSLFPSLTLKNK